jgi:hypothetical protein
MEREVNWARLRGDRLGEAALVDEFASLEGERVNLESTIKEAKTVAEDPRYRRFSTETADDLLAQSLIYDTLPSLDRFK